MPNHRQTSASEHISLIPQTHKSTTGNSKKSKKRMIQELLTEVHRQFPTDKKHFFALSPDDQSLQLGIWDSAGRCHTIIFSDELATVDNWPAVIAMIAQEYPELRKELTEDSDSDKK